MDRRIVEKLSLLGGVNVDEKGDLALLTGFRTGGCAVTVSPENREAFLSAVGCLRETGAEYFVLGNGTNVLAMDEGYDGAVLLTKRALSDISSDGCLIRAGAGASLADVCRKACYEGLSGMEFAYGIPGSVGGAVFMNAGAYGGEMKDILVEAEYLDEEGKTVTIPASELGLAYRSSIFQQHRRWLILSAVFRLEKGDSKVIAETMRETMSKRIEKQPLDYPSCGSTFKRPQGNYASKLIDDCGLRGFTVGGAQVSEKHCGFVINRGGATTADILALIEEVRKKVKEMTGYELECEIEFLR